MPFSSSILVEHWCFLTEASVVLVRVISAEYWLFAIIKYVFFLTKSRYYFALSKDEFDKMSDAVSSFKLKLFSTI